MYDVIVIGARCAGSPTAMLFAQQGYRVLLLEKARFPQDTLSSHYIHQQGIALLNRWGLLDRIRDSGAQPITHQRYEGPGVRIEGFSLPIDGLRTTYAPRRYVLDPILADGAVAAGVDFQQGCAVNDLLFDGDRVTGVRYTTPAGTVTTEQARLVVGADGMRSLVARKTGAPNVIEHPRMTCTYYSYWSGVPSDFELYERTGRWIGVLPTNDDLTLLMAYFPQEDFGQVRKAVEPAYLDAFRTTAPELYERMQAGERVEQLYGTGHQDNYFRKAYGPGWVLVGDAVNHKDSITARGITEAFVQAQTLTDAIGQNLHEDTALKPALRRYENSLGDEALNHYQGALNVAELKPEGRTDMLRKLVGHQQHIDRYFSTLSGACSIDDFYNDELLTLLDQS
ncbi:NAD(P)/FAD-dependent oxidoreductase [Streptomyces sp. NPDC060011]|uniref:NAD(P)/FAD-dependent oxidoreductase n=2 Tax=unclassified Streptomyces TaxID=2593676 RepID=UPI0013BDFFD1|nr:MULTISPECIES: NAD(P)/FAD-dependent oxidoreductase [unclassified Streptomyces]MCX4920135.1 NAD(P)/FAD-dependent oxidoreductase [Streptomyces sp. NBC_00687]MCX5134047.1 NAD(P)/FAD-dependent oxidoreductase [Streptomyces sp. NBC_00340]MCX5136369.1 NAD(P)/FAD-dependent oxidoreductase [Streptomyces sp. NBC_00340]MCX5138309.1 NAD(P)/FAD-dependent oxidoreductase [Streptomyces sp. NBC_00340]MCX5285648.1 NAD(P)/FAD-dependent oxidoreductase [Streptomyces sp. NBC_00198]